MRNLKLILLLVGVLALSGIGPEEVNQEKEGVILHSVIDGMRQMHFDQPVMDDEYSNHVFDRFIRLLDNGKRFFLKEDIDRLLVYRDKLDEMGPNSDFSFFNEAIQILEQRREEASELYSELLAKPFDYDRQEEIVFGYKKLTFANDREELEDLWRRNLKYQVISRLVDKLEYQEEADESDTSVVIYSFDTLEARSRRKIKSNTKDYLHRLDRLDREDYFSLYVNSFTSVIDPHTGYFAPKAKENFDISMSGKLEGIGASLQEENGYVKVVRIVPGSASFRQGDLKEGDLITAVGQADEDPVDVIDMRLDDVVKLIRGPKGTEVRLTVKSVDGGINVIPIVRDVVLLEETYAKSVLLQDQDSDQKIGYIKLPKFYADLNDPRGVSCATDVREEVLRLKEQNMNGLILDLRGNGGGSLNDVVKMVGIFIDQGPVVQVKSRAGEPYVMRDKQSGLDYDGPLIVMVNKSSASASEILAAAIQDYGRGLIVGAGSTYGKGTVQRLINLDRVVQKDLQHLAPLGALKMTVQKFYRINGDATQLKGVQPDVILPDRYNYIDFGESEHDYPMAWDEIAAVDYDMWGSQIDYAGLSSASQERVSTDSLFTLLDANAHRMKENSGDNSSPLNLEEYRKNLEHRRGESERFKDMNRVIEELQVITLPEEEERFLTDTLQRDIAKDWYKRIRKDIQLYETMAIMNDMI